MKNRGDESIWVIIHIYIEMLQGNYLYSYLKEENFHFFFFYTIREEMDRTGPAWRDQGAWYQ
jgi:hypothetical protein